MRKLCAAAVAFLILAPAPGQAQSFAISGHAGTIGVGGGVIIGVAPKLNLRGIFGFIPGVPTIRAEDIDFALDFPTFILTTVDFYPMSGFHLSAGGLFVSSGGDLDVIGSFESQPVEFGGQTYTGSAADELVGTFALKSFQPYAGIGFGNGIGKSVGINLDVGVGFGEKPTVTITPRGPLADDPIGGAIFRSNVQAQVQDIEDDIPEFLRFFPVVALSISIGL